MEVLSNEELEKVNGGTSAIVWYIIGGIGVFLLGIYAGITSKCK